MPKSPCSSTAPIRQECWPSLRISLSLLLIFIWPPTQKGKVHMKFVFLTKQLISCPSSVSLLCLKLSLPSSSKNRKTQMMQFIFFSLNQANQWLQEELLAYEILRCLLVLSSCFKNGNIGGKKCSLLYNLSHVKNVIIVI